MNTIRFFAALLIALTPMIIVAVLENLGFHAGRANAGWSIICSIMLLGVIAHRVFIGGWRA